MNVLFFKTHFDRLGHKPKLFFKKQERDTSLVGAIISVLVGLGICAITFYYFIEFFLGIGMTVISSKDNINHAISLDLKDRLFMFQFGEKIGNRLDPRLASLHAVQWDTDDETNNLTHFKLEQCEYGKHISQKEYQDILKNVNISHYLCFEPKSNVLSYDSGSLISYFMVYVATCTNTSSFDNCYEQSQIYDILNHSNHYFSYLIFNTKVDHKNVSSPLTLSFFNQRTLLIPTVNYDYTLNYKYIEYKSNKGWLVNNWKTFTGYQFDEAITERIIHAVSEKYPIENTYASFKFRLSPLSCSIYEREFPKLQSIIANVSALIKVVFVCGELLVGLFSRGRYYVSVFNISQEIIKSKIKNSNNNNMTFPKDFGTARVPTFMKKKINPIVYCQWIIFPNLNRRTAYVEACRRKISEFLGVENIIKKLYSSEMILSTLQEKASNNKNLSNSFIYLNTQVNHLNLNDNSNLQTQLRRTENNP